MPRSGKRVYEVKNNNVAPLLLYAGPTSADLETLCRVSTKRRISVKIASDSNVGKYQSAGRCFPVFPQGPAPSAQRGVWHPSGLTALGAKGCVRCRSGGKGLGGRPSKRRGASSDKTFTTALEGEGKTGNPRLWRERNALPLWWLTPPPFPRKRGHYGYSALCHMTPKGNVERYILPPE